MALLKIATFNVNGVKGRLPRLLEWLQESQPDVVCLQEIKTGDATIPALASGADSEQRGREQPSDHAPVWITLAS